MTMLKTDVLKKTPLQTWAYCVGGAHATKDIQSLFVRYRGDLTRVSRAIDRDAPS